MDNWINELINSNTHLNSYKLKDIFIMFLVFGINGSIITLFSCMIIPLKNYYHMELFTLEIVCASVFLGISIGNYYVVSLVNLFGRLNTLKLGLVILMISSMISVLVNSAIIFLMLRLLCGIGNGIQMTLSLAIFCDKFPSKYKVSFLCMAWTGFYVFQFINLLLVYVFIPDYEISKTPLILGLFSIIQFICSAIVFVLFEDSPQSYIMEGKTAKGFEVINKLISPQTISKGQFDINLPALNFEVGNYEDEKATCDSPLLEAHIVHEDATQFKKLFSLKFRKSSMNIIICSALISALFYGPLLITSLTMMDLKSKQTINSYSHVIHSSMFISASLGIATFVSGILNDLLSKSIKRTMLVCYSFALLFNIAITLNTHSFCVFESFSLIFSSVGSNIFLFYCAELYPIKYRNLAISATFLANKLGAGFSQLLFLELNSIGVLMPYYAIALICLLILYLVITLPHDI